MVYVIVSHYGWAEKIKFPFENRSRDSVIFVHSRRETNSF